MTSPQSESKEDWEEQASLAIVEETKMSTLDATNSVILGSHELALGVVAEEHEETAHTVSCPKDINYDKDWIIDSRCSNHMTGDKSKFLNLAEYKGGKVVVTANDARLPITHIGEVTCIPRFSKKEAQLQKVFHMPGMRKNLLSVSQLTSSGNFIVFGPNDVNVYQNLKLPDKPIITGRRLDSVYVMSTESAYVKKTCQSETTDLWHTRLGHVGFNKLRVMMSRSILKGLPDLEV